MYLADTRPLARRPSTVYRVVRLPDGHRVSLGEYVRSWKEILNLVREDRGDAKLWGFHHSERSAREILDNLRDGMHDRINRKIPGYGVGRKWSMDWFMDAYRLWIKLNYRHIIRERDVPREWRKRLAHRITKPEDE